MQTIKPSPLYLKVIDSENQRVGGEVKDIQIASQFLIPLHSTQPNNHCVLIENIKKGKPFQFLFQLHQQLLTQKPVWKGNLSSNYSCIHSFPHAQPSTLILCRGKQCACFTYYSLVLPITTNYMWVPLIEKMLCWSYVFCQKCSFLANKSVLGQAVT